MEKKDKITIFLICLIFFILSIIIWNKNTYWDSAVYLGIGKYLWSFGNIGLFEPARPIVWPMILGFFWRIGIDGLIFGKILGIGIGTGSILIAYLLMRQISGRVASTIFALMFALNQNLILYSGQNLVSIPAMFFALLAFYMLFKEKIFSAGLLVGLSAMTKFTYAIFFLIFLLWTLINKKNYWKLITATSIIVLPFMIYNWIAYNNPLYSIINAHTLIKSVAMNLYSKGNWLFYLNSLFYENILLLFSLVSIFLIKEKKVMVYWLAFLLPFIYHSLLLNYKHIRYEFIFLAFIYIISATGFDYIYKRSGKIAKTILIAAAIIQMIIIAGNFNFPGNRQDIYKGFYNLEADGVVWSSNPFIAVGKDIKISEMIYYPYFDNKKLDELTRKIDEPDYIFINTCDIPCIDECDEKKQEFFNLLNQKFKEVMNEEIDGCNLYVYSR